MPACDQFRQNFRQHLIQDYYQNFDTFSKDKYFLAIGKPTRWINSAGQNTDTLPPKNLDSVKSDTDFWRSSMVFKQIQKSDVSIVVKRFDWVANEIYDAYRDDLDLYDDVNPARFYVLVDEERVYKCIDNNYGVPSTIAPTHLDSSIRTLSDGYRWKYLYSIPPSKRKFLTKTQGSSIGYMPVEFVTKIQENDERILQYEVQKDAVDGSIDFIELKENLKNITISDRVLFFDIGNQVLGTTAAGATSVVLGGSNLVFENNYYNNMTINFESGSGSGQRRKIVKYYPNDNASATAILETPLNYGISAGADPTLYSIYPTVLVVGDGEAYPDPLHGSASSAEVTVSFLSKSAPGTTSDCVCSGTTGQRYLDSFELSNRGKNYTYADLEIVAGLTFVSSLGGDINLLARAIMSPEGGHGSNAVKELGASSLMIITDFRESENCKITTENEYRQFGLVVNPLLAKKQVHLYLDGPGNSLSFQKGDSAVQGTTGYNGVTGFDIVSSTVFGWRYGATGTTNSAELIVTNITGGNFAINGIINGITANRIFKIEEKTIAGTEHRILKRLKLVPTLKNTFDISGFLFTNNYIAFGEGNSGSNIEASLANGTVYNWELELGTNYVGSVYLDNLNGDFNLSEHVYQRDHKYKGITGPLGQIIEITDYEESPQLIYDQTIRLRLNFDGINNFADSSFDKDQIISTVSGSAYVVDWTPLTGSTAGNIRILPIKGNLKVGQNIIYNNSGNTGGTINSIISEQELKYHSGTVLHVQNIRPVERTPESRDEIKLIVEF